MLILMFLYVFVCVKAAVCHYDPLARPLLHIAVMSCHVDHEEQMVHRSIRQRLGDVESL